MIYILSYILNTVCIVIVVTVHGFLTALTSDLLGDNTSKNMVSLNPKKHVEPLGFLFMLFFRFGWGQPVKTTSYYYKNKKTGLLLTGVIPIAAGIILGVALMGLSVALSQITAEWIGYAAYFIQLLGTTALRFAIFNIIPIYPLSGSKIITALLSPNGIVKYNQMEKIFQIVLMLVIIMGVLNTPFFMIEQFVMNIFG